MNGSAIKKYKTHHFYTKELIYTSVFYVGDPKAMPSDFRILSGRRSGVEGFLASVYS